MSLKNRTIEYLQLLRIQTAVLTALTPLLGGLVMGQRDLIPLCVLFLIGFFYHVYGFVLNEYIDIDVDKKSVHLKKKPLVSNIIAKEYALFIALFACICSCVLAIFFFSSVFSALLLLWAIILGGTYNIFGKKLLGSDFVLGGGFFLLCLMGASTVSINFTFIAYLLCLIYFIHIVFNNAVEGGLKDVDHDHLAGAKTLATRAGVSVQHRMLKVTKKFVGFSYVLKFIFMFLIGILCIQPEINLFNYEKNMLQILFVVFFAIIIVFTMYKFLSISVFDRSKLKRLFSVHEMSSYSMLIISLSPLIELRLTIFLIFLPLVWYILFNFVLYGKLLQPQV